MQEMEQTRVRGISGSTLKLIAVISMLIDHFAAGILGRYLGFYGRGELVYWWGSLDAVNRAYWIMRLIGRFAFPIYCFLLVEGFQHTRSRGKYAARLFAFALLSEIPFDLLFNGRLLEFTYQNVFFTLLLGMLTMWGYDWISKRERLAAVCKVALYAAVIAAGMYAAHFLHTDYAARGVFCILALYVFREKYQLFAGCIAFAWELPAPLAFIPIAFYNGRRGWNLKYLFYLFYPAHLLVLYLLCMALGEFGLTIFLM